MSQYKITKQTLKNKTATIWIKEKGEARPHKVTIEPCHGSFVQWGAVEKVLCFTMPIAEKLVENNFVSF